MNVVFTTQAKAGLRDIALFIARDNPSRALTFIQELRTVAMQLAETPRAYPLIPRYERHGIRRRVYQEYLILYRVEAEQIAVVHILHGARNYLALLFPDTELES